MDDQKKFSIFASANLADIEKQMNEATENNYALLDFFTPSYSGGTYTVIMVLVPQMFDVPDLSDLEAVM